VTKTIITCFITLASAFLIGGCANNPTVHLYGKYLEEPKLQALTEKLEEQGLNVEANNFDFPTTVNSNTLLYSLLLRSSEVIDKTASIAEFEGYPIINMQALTQGNHWYTKDSLALFLFPDGRKPKGTLLTQDLTNTYKGENCGDGQRLTLNKNGTYQLTLKTINNEVNTKGHWKFRQFPYLELQELNSPYANYYFEISQIESEDKVSKLNLTQLQLLNANSTNPLASECVFIHGIRI